MYLLSVGSFPPWFDSVRCFSSLITASILRQYCLTAQACLIYFNFNFATRAGSTLRYFVLQQSMLTEMFLFSAQCLSWTKRLMKGVQLSLYLQQVLYNKCCLVQQQGASIWQWRWHWLWWGCNGIQSACLFQCNRKLFWRFSLRGGSAEKFKLLMSTTLPPSQRSDAACNLCSKGCFVFSAAYRVVEHICNW